MINIEKIRHLKGEFLKSLNDANMKQHEFQVAESHEEIKALQEDMFKKFHNIMKVISYEISSFEKITKKSFSDSGSGLFEKLIWEKEDIESKYDHFISSEKDECISEFFDGLEMDYQKLKAMFESYVKYETLRNEKLRISTMDGYEKFTKELDNFKTSCRQEIYPFEHSKVIEWELEFKKLQAEMSLLAGKKNIESQIQTVEIFYDDLRFSIFERRYKMNFKETKDLFDKLQSEIDKIIKILQSNAEVSATRKEEMKAKLTEMKHSSKKVFAPIQKVYGK